MSDKFKIAFLDRSTIRADISVHQPGFPHIWAEYDKTENQAQALERLQDADIVITNKVPITASLITACPELKMVAVAATGVDHIDIKACHAHDITISNIRNYALRTVPEHVIGMILTLRRQVLQYRQEVIQGRWQQENNFCFFDQQIQDINGATLGIIGYGAIGQATARLAHALGMQVQYTSRSAKAVDFARPVDLDTLLHTSDVISCHCPLTPETHHLLDAVAFGKMKSSAIVINSARGNIVDEQALADALTRNKVAAAAIDVLPQEPPASNSPMMQLANQTNVILTPHIAWASQQAMQTLADQLIDNIEAFIAGKPKNIV
ncbi:MAG: D-2-hydroxyacid dehydrogenase [Gammaproteobacteria bacterium]|nr:D-2-hydroxyacid dehydrogenase [Gammaproteobacteria bacterium]